MKYIIQTRQEKNRGIDVGRIMSSSGGDIKDWNNYSHTFSDYEKAIAECESLIKSSRHKAENVRVLKVVCNFEAEVNVIAKSGEPND